MERHLIGTGVLDWNRGERITDRFGTISLFDPEDDEVMYPINQQWEGKKGKLIASIRPDTPLRLSARVGAVKEGWRPEKDMPKQGCNYILGIGTLFTEVYDESDVKAPGLMVGVKPDDGRERRWLRSQTLHRIQGQLVDIFFEERKEEKSDTIYTTAR